MGKVRGVLLDLDGVVYVGETPIEGAAEAVAWLRAHSIPHRFVTNTTSRPRSAIVEQLRRMGIEAGVDRIWCPPAALREWLRTQPPGPVALFAPSVVAEELEGVPLLDASAESGARFVVIGDLGADWDFRALNRAFRLLMADEGAALVGLGGTKYWRAEDGLRLDVAPFVAALTEATGREALVLGKPSRAFYETAVAGLGLPSGEVLMVGDDVRVDVGGAQAAGLRGALVRTGKFRESDLDGPVTPDLVLDSIADLPDRWAALAS